MRPCPRLALALCVCISLLQAQRVHSMHPQARAFLAYVSSNFSSFFRGEALDVVLAPPLLVSKPFYFYIRVLWTSMATTENSSTADATTQAAMFCLARTLTFLCRCTGCLTQTRRSTSSCPQVWEFPGGCDSTRSLTLLPQRRWSTTCTTWPAFAPCTGC